MPCGHMTQALSGCVHCSSRRAGQGALHHPTSLSSLAPRRPQQIPAECVLVLYADLDLPPDHLSPSPAAVAAPTPMHFPLQIPAERVLVVYDDLDLATAAVRLRAKGGHGGHNGMKSIAGGATVLCALALHWVAWSAFAS